MFSTTVKVVCIAKERSRTGDGEGAVHVQIDAENHSVLSLLVARISGVDFFLDCDVEVVRTVPFVERGFLAFPVIRSILREGCPRVVFGRDELGGHAVAHGGEGHMVVVIGDGSPVVHDN